MTPQLAPLARSVWTAIAAPDSLASDRLSVRRIPSLLGRGPLFLVQDRRTQARLGEAGAQNKKKLNGSRDGQGAGGSEGLNHPVPAHTGHCTSSDPNARRQGQRGNLNGKSPRSRPAAKRWAGFIARHLAPGLVMIPKAGHHVIRSPGGERVGRAESGWIACVRFFRRLVTAVCRASAANRRWLACAAPCGMRRSRPRVDGHPASPSAFWGGFPDRPIAQYRDVQG